MDIAPMSALLVARRIGFEPYAETRRRNDQTFFSLRSARFSAAGGSRGVEVARHMWAAGTGVPAMTRA